MTKLILPILAFGLLFGDSAYTGSTLAPVVVAGGIIKAQNSDTANKKYKRKDCPVCKGKGWYISGDGIKKVDCGYCEPDIQDVSESEKCEDGKCPSPSNKTVIIRR